MPRSMSLLARPSCPRLLHCRQAHHRSRNHRKLGAGGQARSDLELVHQRQKGHGVVVVLSGRGGDARTP